MVRIDYYLKGCMVEQKCKNNITGSDIALMIPAMESTISPWRLVVSEL